MFIICFMYIRKTKKVIPETQKAYFVYQLVESVRTERGPRQRILLSLGSDIDVIDEDLKLLANRIEEIITGAKSFYPYSEKIEGLAEVYASKLLQRISKTTPMTELIEEQTDYQSIDMQTIEQQEPRTVGAEHLLLHFISQVGLQEKLRELGFSKKEVALSLAMIIGRAVFPASERATYEWLIHRSGLGELIDFDFHKTSLYQLYKVSDLLLEHKSDIEKYLATAEQTVYSYPSTMILYDLTNTYMEGQAKANLKAKRGFSKEKRFDCPLITLGLVINEHGFATRSSFFPGNISEPKTLEQAIHGLYDCNDLFKPVVILDAGIATEENLQWLRTHNFFYVISARQNAPSMELEGPLADVGDPEKTKVKAALIKSNDSEERWLYCESEAKEATASQIKTAFCRRFEVDLLKLREGLRKPKCRKQYGKILERVGRLKEKHSRISGCYEITVTASSDGQLATEIRWTLKAEKLEDRLNGHYFLRTNLKGISAKALWNLYNSIRTIEDAFRFMKSTLGLRPVYHQKEHRVDGHLWITILAYHLIHSCLYQLNKQGIFYHWPTIRKRMSSRIRVTICAKTQGGKTLYHRSTTKAEKLQREIYQALGLNTQILRAKKISV